MVCENIFSGLECWKGPLNFWYRHDCATHVTSDFKKHINKIKISGPDFNYQHFSDETHTKGAGDGTCQYGAPNDTTNTAATATNNHNGGGNFETEEVNTNNKNVKTQIRNIIFNYSSLVLTKAMEALLNRALSFCVLPLKLDITQVLVDINRFSRATIWHEYWYEREKDQRYEKPIFKKLKRNLPKNYSSPSSLKFH